MLQVKKLVVDLATRRVTVSGKEVKLSKVEYDLLRLLARLISAIMSNNIDSNVFEPII